VENISHSLIGVVLGEGVLQIRKRARARGGAGASANGGASGGGGASDSAGGEISPALRAGVLWAAVLGSNMPDSDVFCSYFVGGGSLGSLLHHRGFTHTLVALPLLALIAAAVGRWVARVRREGGALPSWRLLGAVASAGVLGHLIADFWNDYGLHPFWPLTGRWFYGDMIFILEPLFWMGLLPFAFFGARARVLRGLCVFLALVVLGLCWSGKFQSWQAAAWVTSWGVAWSLVQWRLRGRPEWAVGLAALALMSVLELFFVGRQIARSRVEAILPPGEELLALSTSPAPGNPFCWRVILTSRKGGESGEYIARMGGWAMGPSEPSSCLPRMFPAVGPGLGDALTGPVEPGLLRSGFAWAGEFRAGLRDFSEKLRTHCRMGALLRFVRTPFWKFDASGVGLVGDLRYHSPERRGFAEIETTAGEECYSLTPPWTPPSGLLKQ
jgi:inner membrane protein